MPIISHLADGVLELRLNRPQRLNALTLAMAQALLAAVQAGVADERVRVLLLTGEGRAFCAGKDRDDPATPAFVSTLQALALALMQCPQPVVSAVQGWVVGAGLELMLNTDLTLAAHSARFQLPEVHVGLLGTGGVAALLPRLVGLQKAKGMLLLGQAFSAAEAERWGLLWRVVDEAALPTEARQLAQQLAQSDPRILATMKRLLHTESVGAIDLALAREAAAHAQLAGE